MTGIVALALASDPRPADNNVVAGWVGAAVFVGLILAVVLILRSFTKQLKKVNAAEQAGVFEDESEAAERSSDETSSHHQS
jgi:TRAP-type C4-dicarboxylate transport system permease small subunit